MHHRLFIFAVLFVFALSAGLTIAQDDPLAGVDPSGVVIEYWHEWDGAQEEGINAVIELFEQTNEFGITVNAVKQGNTGQLEEQISTGIISGQLPNLVGAAFVNNAMSWFLDDVLVPLDVFFDHPEWGFSEEEIADLNEDILNINRPTIAPFNGQLLAWPIGTSANVLSVNLDMLSELGFDGPPTTLEEFREVACAANELTTEDGDDVMGFPIRTSANDLYSFILSNGGFIFDEEADAYNFTNEKAIEILQFFQDLFNDGCAYIPDGPFVNTADFAFGLNPMAVGSSVGVPFISRDIEASGSGIENWINTTTPWSDDNRALQIFLRGIAIMENTPEENLATWLFIKFLASPQAQVIWTEAAQYQPYTQSGLEGLSDSFLDENPQFGTVREVLLDPDIHLWATPANLAQNDVDDIVEELVVNITTGGQDVMEAAAAAEAEANEIYQESLEALE